MFEHIINTNLIDSDAVIWNIVESCFTFNWSFFSPGISITPTSFHTTFFLFSFSTQFHAFLEESFCNKNSPIIEGSQKIERRKKEEGKQSMELTHFSIHFRALMRTLLLNWFTFTFSKIDKKKTRKTPIRSF